MTYREILDELFSLHEEGFKLGQIKPDDNYQGGDAIGEEPVMNNSFQKVYDLADKINKEINK